MNQYPYPYPSGPPKTEGLAVVSLVLGILSLVACNIFTGIPAIICGHMSRSRIERSNGTVAGGGLAIAGLVLGYFSVALLAVGVAGFLIMGAAVGFSIPVFQKALAVQTIDSMSPRIVAACDQYRRDNGKFPAATKTSGEQVNADELFAILTAADGKGEKYYNAAGNGIHVNGTPRDMWGEILQVALDLDGDGKVNLNGTVVEGTVLVWSKGVNKQNEFGGGDDVKSW